jgi:hypothetical protein
MISPSEEQAGPKARTGRKISRQEAYQIAHAMADTAARELAEERDLDAKQLACPNCEEQQAEITRLKEQKGRLVGAIQTARLHSNPRLADEVLLDALADDGWDIDNPRSTPED